jgi:transcription elongation factor Elf1
MITFDCPWCAEPAMVETADADELTCNACGVRADLASDPVAERIAQAA